MSVSTPRPPQKKKSGCGCFGCGCLFGIILLLLLGALVGGLAYFGYNGMMKVTTTTAGDMPTFAPTDNGYAAVQQKLSDFQQNTQKHQPATIHLTSDDLNNLIAHNPDFTSKNIRVYVTLTGEQGRLQASLPTDSMVQGLLPGRYLDIDTTLEVGFDQQTKSVVLNPKALKFGANELTGKDSSNSSFTRAITPVFNQSFNQGLRKNPDVAKFLDQTQSIEIKDSELVIQTQ